MSSQITVLEILLKVAVEENERQTARLNSITEMVGRLREVDAGHERVRERQETENERRRDREKEGEKTKEKKRKRELEGERETGKGKGERENKKQKQKEKQKEITVLDRERNKTHKAANISEGLPALPKSELEAALHKLASKVKCCVDGKDANVRKNDWLAAATKAGNSRTREDAQMQTNTPKEEDSVSHPQPIDVDTDEEDDPLLLSRQIHGSSRSTASEQIVVPGSTSGYGEYDDTVSH
ncbi:hypothetical protein FRC17_010520 [Serendipita sp. 399]|nr:hypothetical protein FRC17_010520 [Serendipita sp. 399]